MPATVVPDYFTPDTGVRVRRAYHPAALVAVETADSTDVTYVSTDDARKLAAVLLELADEADAKATPDYWVGRS